MANKKFNEVVTKEDILDLLTFKYSVTFNSQFESVFDRKAPFTELLNTKGCVAKEDFEKRSGDAELFCSFSCRGNNTWSVNVAVVDFGGLGITNRLYLEKCFEKVTDEESFKKVLEEFNYACKAIATGLDKYNGFNGLIEMLSASYFKGFNFDEYGDGSITRKIRGQE